jgi:hypothetical protein
VSFLAAVSHVGNAKKKVLKELKIVTSENTQMVKKHNSLIAHMEKVLMVWKEDRTFPSANT